MTFINNSKNWFKSMILFIWLNLLTPCFKICIKKKTQKKFFETYPVHLYNLCHHLFFTSLYSWDFFLELKHLYISQKREKSYIFSILTILRKKEIFKMKGIIFICKYATYDKVLPFISFYFFGLSFPVVISYRNFHCSS